jgi:hypothetical protein
VKEILVFLPPSNAANDAKREQRNKTLRLLEVPGSGPRDSPLRFPDPGHLYSSSKVFMIGAFWAHVLSCVRETLATSFQIGNSTSV